LPKQLPDPAGWEFAACYRPAREVGGDFYDVIPLPDGRLGFVIGDVTDKGVPAALLMAATRSLLRAAALQGLSPAEVLRQVNDMLFPDMPAKMFVTCLYAILDPATSIAIATAIAIRGGYERLGLILVMGRFSRSCTGTHLHSRFRLRV
jgi:serine phosphatase RsbU (regulator of sigma subunit)